MLTREFSPAGVASRPPAARLRARAASHPRGHLFTGCCPQAALDAPRSRDLPGVLEHLTLFPPKTDRTVLPLSRPARCGPGGRAPPPAASASADFSGGWGPVRASPEPLVAFRVMPRASTLLPLGVNECARSPFLGAAFSARSFLLPSPLFWTQL